MAEREPQSHLDAESCAVNRQHVIIQVEKSTDVILALVHHVISLAKKFWRNVVTCVLLHVMIKH